VVVPLGGLSVQDAEGKAFWEPEADAAFVRELQRALDPRVGLHLVPHHINDPEFVEFVLEQLTRLLPPLSSPVQPDEDQPQHKTLAGR
jgi:uncharacterized protein (UPF0261 family)